MRITQRDRVINYIRDFGSITRAEAFIELGIVELPARICELEGQGFEFEKSTVRKRNRYGDPVKFIRYALKEEQPCEN